MNKIYLIYGVEKYLIDKEINKIKEEYSDYDFVSYDMLENNISEALEDASMYSLFSSNKLILCTNSVFLTGSKCDIDHNIDELIKYINSDTTCILILSVITDKLDNRKKVVKELNKFNVIKFDKLKRYELNKFVKDYSFNNGFKISDEAINLLLDKLNEDLYIITSELDKLFIYKSNKSIEEVDVKECTSKMLNSDIFDLINAIVKRDVDRALECYDDLIILSEEEIKLIVTLANQFRLIYQVKNMYKSGYSEFDICKSLGGIHPYRVKMAYNVDITLNECLLYIKKLSVLDESIKMGLVDKKSAFLNFILEMK